MIDCEIQAMREDGQRLPNARGNLDGFQLSASDVDEEGYRDEIED